MLYLLRLDKFLHKYSNFWYTLSSCHSFLWRIRLYICTKFFVCLDEVYQLANYHKSPCIFISYVKNDVCCGFNVNCTMLELSKEMEVWKCSYNVFLIFYYFCIKFKKWTFPPPPPTFLFQISMHFGYLPRRRIDCTFLVAKFCRKYRERCAKMEVNDRAYRLFLKLVWINLP